MNSYAGIAAGLAVAALLAGCGGDSDPLAVEDKPAVSAPKPTAPERYQRPDDAPAWVEVTGAAIGQNTGAHALGATSGTDLTPGVASFKPAAPGAAVTVERKTGSGWEKVASGTQNSKGRFSFFAAAGTPDKPAVFRTSTVPRSGREAIVSEENAARPPATDWNDEFDGTKLGDGWLFQQGRSDTRQCALGWEPNTTVSGGTANLSASMDSTRKKDTTCPDGYFHNGRISTIGLKTFRYGTIAARIKLHAAQGAHASFWLQHPPHPGAIPGDAATTGGEIDIVEYFGDGQKYNLQNSSWFPTLNDAGVAEMKQSKVKMTATEALADGHEASEGYHVYSVEWSPTSYVFRVDGVETYRMTEGISRVPEYLILSILTSDWETPKAKAKEFPTTMKVDWVRVWK